MCPSLRSDSAQIGEWFRRAVCDPRVRMFRSVLSVGSCRSAQIFCSSENVGYEQDCGFCQLAK